MADTIRTARIHDLEHPNSKPYRRGKIADILSHIAKFAFESTLVESFRISTGRKQEESKDQPVPLPFDDKNKNEHRDLKLVREEMQAKIEKMQEDINKMKQCHKISANCVEKSEALKKISDEKLQAIIEKMQEDMNEVKQQHKVSAKGVEKSGLPKKELEGDMEGWDFVQKDRKRVFIRSRL